MCWTFAENLGTALTLVILELDGLSGLQRDTVVGFLQVYKTHRLDEQTPTADLKGLSSSPVTEPDLHYSSWIWWLRTGCRLAAPFPASWGGRAVWCPSSWSTPTAFFKLETTTPVCHSTCAIPDFHATPKRLVNRNSPLASHLMNLIHTQCSAAEKISDQPYHPQSGPALNTPCFLFPEGLAFHFYGFMFIGLLPIRHHRPQVCTFICTVNTVYSDLLFNCTSG